MANICFLSVQVWEVKHLTSFFLSMTEDLDLVIDYLTPRICETATRAVPVIAFILMGSAKMFL